MDHAIPPPVPKDRSRRKSRANDEDQSVLDGGGNRKGSVDDGDSLMIPGRQQRKLSAMEIIDEILNPSLKIPETVGPYRAPKPVRADDVDALNELDENKIIELKEVFKLFDSDADGFISEQDLQATLIALGSDASSAVIQQMLSEARNPLDFDAFVLLMGYKTIELDPVDVLIEAWSKWDEDGTGLINEERIFFDLINFGDAFTEKEARSALEEAPLVKPKTFDEPPMIDYSAFCKTMGGLRKRRQEPLSAV